jgi:Fic family protein
LKGVAASIPTGPSDQHPGPAGGQDSSEIENIVTTHDSCSRATCWRDGAQPGCQKVLRYREALRVGFDHVRKTGLITNNHGRHPGRAGNNQAGFRRLPGTALKDGGGRTVYTPPQDAAEIVALMGALGASSTSLGSSRPTLVKMALIHHRFETIHPFYDGNGRTGRILNVLYLVKEGLLDIPVLYLSSYIVRHKADYYRLLQAVRDEDRWEAWVLYMLQAVEHTAAQGIATIGGIKTALFDYKHRIRAAYRFYSQDLINNLFTHPYTKIEHVQRDLQVSRLTASKYLDALADGGFVRKLKVGRSNYYVNVALNAVLLAAPMPPHHKTTSGA